jgi:hypothetical protein
MRAHTEEDDTIWSFVKVFLQFLLKTIILIHILFQLFGNYILLSTSNCVVLFFMLIVLKQILNTKISTDILK